MWHRIRNAVWPDMGWARYARYVWQRIVRLADSPRNIALGLALGLAASFNPFVGTHIIQACAVSVVLRANAMAAIIGTFFGNPLTFSFFWYGAYWVGRFILNGLGFDMDIQVQSGAELLELAKQEPQKILYPWIVGGYGIAFIVTPVSYCLFYPLVKAAKALRERQKERASA